MYDIELYHDPGESGPARQVERSGCTSLLVDDFYRSLADAERELRADPEAWAEFDADRSEWLNAKLT